MMSIANVSLWILRGTILTATVAACDSSSPTARKKGNIASRADSPVLTESDPVASGPALSGAEGSDTVIGSSDGFAMVDGSPILRGWACLPAVKSQIRVDVYENASGFDGGTIVGNTVADVSSEPLPCETGMGHRFEFKLNAAQHKKYAGKTLFVHGVDPRGNGRNPLLNGGGRTVPGEVVVEVDSALPTTAGADLREKVQNLMNNAVAQSEATGKSVELVFRSKDYSFDCSFAEPVYGALECTSSKFSSSCLNLTGSKPDSTARVIISGASGAAASPKFTFTTPLSGGIKATNLSSISINRIELERLVPPATQGTISSVNSGWIKLQIDEGMPNFSNTVCACYNSQMTIPNQRTFSYVLNGDSYRGKSAPNQIPGTLHSFKACGISGRTVDLLVDGDSKYFSPGDRLIQLQGGDWRGSGFYFERNADVSVNSTAVYSAAGLAYMFTMNSGVIALSGNKVMPSGSRRFSTNADSFHFQHNWAQVIATSNSVRGMADDGFNTYTVPSKISAVANSQSIDLTPQREFRVGDFVQIYSYLDNQIRGHANISAISAIDGGKIRLTLASPIDGVQPCRADGSACDNVANVSAATPNSIFSRNVFGWHRGRHIVNRAAYVTIKDNVFDEINWLGVFLGNDHEPFHEGPIPHGVKVEGNIFRGGDFAYVSPIEISGSSTKGTVVHGPFDIQVSGNVLCNFPAPTAIKVGINSRVTESGNTVNGTGCN